MFMWEVLFAIFHSTQFSTNQNEICAIFQRRVGTFYAAKYLFKGKIQAE